MAAKKEAPRQRRVAGESGNKVENVKNVVRDKDGRVVAKPGDVRYVRDEVGVVDEIAREQGEL